jgi:hypothetical protein
MEPLEFEMTSSKMKKSVYFVLLFLLMVKEKDGGNKELPTFQFKGKIDSRFCNIVAPLTGELQIINCTIPIRSVELQLVRAETINGAKPLEGLKKSFFFFFF